MFPVVGAIERNGKGRNAKAILWRIPQNKKRTNKKIVRRDRCVTVNCQKLKREMKKIMEEHKEAMWLKCMSILMRLSSF